MTLNDSTYIFDRLRHPSIPAIVVGPTRMMNPAAAVRPVPAFSQSTHRNEIYGHPAYRLVQPGVDAPTAAQKKAGSP
jgi:hypothetical protein